MFWILQKKQLQKAYSMDFYSNDIVLGKLAVHVYCK